MDLTIWGAFIEIILFGIRILLWPLGIVIKYRTAIPYLILGATALIAVIGVFEAITWVLRAIFNAFSPRISKRATSGARPSDHGTSAEGSEEKASKGSDVAHDPYKVLGVSRGVSSSNLCARYRELLKANHPDRVAQLDPEIQAFAEERSKRIIAAYQELAAGL